MSGRPACATTRSARSWSGFTAARISSGTSNEIETDGARLSRRGDVVVVTVNHRLNAFGYLHLAEFDGALADSGNAGQLDLILALEWVRDNIAEFGGNAAQRHDLRPFGRRREVRDADGDAESAPACFIASSRKADSRSPRAGSKPRIAMPRRWSTRWASIAATIAQLRTLPMEQIVKVSRVPPYLGPVKDGRLLPRDPFDPDAPPQSAHIPMILGNTKGETRTLIGRGDPSLFALTWETLLPKLEANSPFMGTLSRADVIAKYREWHPQYTPADVFFAATTDSRSWRGQVIEADRRAAQPAGSAPTFVYQFDWPTPIDGGKWGAHHGLDVPFTFDNAAITPHMVGAGRGAGRRCRPSMSRAFIAFARTGDPNTTGLPPGRPSI